MANIHLPYVQQRATHMTTGTRVTGPVRFLFYSVFASAVGEECSSPRYMSRRNVHLATAPIFVFNWSATSSIFDICHGFQTVAATLFAVSVRFEPSTSGQL